MKEFQVWSCGGGVQSAAIGALIVQGRLPKPDLAVIIDTERERTGTWEYMDGTIKPALTAVGVEIIRVPKSSHTGSDLYRENGRLVIPYFTETGGKAPGWCSGDWKRDVLDRYLRTQGITKSSGCIWLGISVDEKHRIRATGNYRYPLIFDVPLRRGECLKLVHDMGWPEPPKSACWMCPNHDNEGWRNLRDHHAEDFAKAVQLEHEIRERDPSVYLHRSCMPLGQAFIDDPNPNQLSFGDMCAGMCWV